VSFIRARAKINLTLNVRPLSGSSDPGQRVASPYHELSSVFHLIELADEVSWGSAQDGRFGLSCTGPGVEDLPLSENLAWRAAQAFAKSTGRELPAIHIHIEKHIPLGAGLAGGSADAAAVLLLLARADKTVPDPLLSSLAASLGADVAFFLAKSAACLMGGAGDELRAALRPAAGLPVVVAWDPAAPVSTPEVYRAFDQHLAPVDTAGEAALASALKCADIEQVASHLYNNLSAAAFSVSPAARKVFEFLDGAPQSLAAALSGSGGASFALCASPDGRDTLARDARDAGLSACATELAGSTSMLSGQIAPDQKVGWK